LTQRRARRRWINSENLASESADVSASDTFLDSLPNVLRARSVRFAIEMFLDLPRAFSRSVRQRALQRVFHPEPPSATALSDHDGKIQNGASDPGSCHVSQSFELLSESLFE
jgi:hypothetical protein